MILCHFNQLPWFNGFQVNELFYPALGDLPVLAKFAMQIATYTSDGEDVLARMEMVKWLFFNRVGVDRTNLGVILGI